MPIITNDSIPEGKTTTQDDTTAQTKQNGGRRKWSKSGHNKLHYDSKVRSMAVKCYDEQLPYGWQFVQSKIKAVDPSLFQIVAIKHDKDRVSDGHFWKTALEKEHYHVLLRSAKNESHYVKDLLLNLGIVFRPGTDDLLWDNHAVETVNNFAGYTTYLTHETEDAISAGKEPYDRNELVSNLDADRIDEIREGYFSVSGTAPKLTNKALAELDTNAYSIGYALKDFDAWYDAQSFKVRSNAKMKTIKESYDRGVRKRIEEDNQVLRLCVYIQGKANTGKTYASVKALSGKRILTIEGGGTGKFDNLKPSTDAIIVSDDTCPNLLNMTDNYICRAYRRQSNNPAWAGQYFIVTSNLSFEDWLDECHITSPEHIRAMRTRFFICTLKQRDDGTSYLALKSPCKRGSVAEQKTRAEMFMAFQKEFNATIATYKPSEETFDYLDMIAPEFLTGTDRVEYDDRKALEEAGISLGRFTKDQIRTTEMQLFSTFFWEEYPSGWRDYLSLHSNDSDEEKLRYAESFAQNISDKDLLAVQRYYNQQAGTECAFTSEELRKAVWWYLDRIDEMN